MRSGRIIGAGRSVMGDDTVPCPGCEPKLAGLVLLVGQPHVLVLVDLGVLEARTGGSHAAVARTGAVAKK